jgi:transcriptional regulator with XRE-family HTH domain
MKTTLNKTNFGEYLHQLRIERQLPLRTVADKLGIDISLLSKIEHGERFVQTHMLEKIALVFNLDYRTLQIQFLTQRISGEYGNEPFWNDVVQELSKKYE